MKNEIKKKMMIRNGVSQTPKVTPRNPLKKKSKKF